MEKENRLYYLDAARGFAILLVVLGHIWETEQLLPVLIYSFHVPLFFCISGILTAHTGQAQRPLSQVVCARFRSLILPYLFFELIFTVLSGIRDHFGPGDWLACLRGCLLLEPLNVPLWFLPTLFLTELLLILAVRLAARMPERTGRFCLAAFFALLYLVPILTGNMRILPDALRRCLVSAGFLAAGWFACPLIKRKNPPTAILLAVMAGNGILAWLNGKTGIYKLTFHNPLLFTVCAATGSCCVIFLLKKRRLKLLELIGKNSVAILGLHIIVLRAVQAVPGLDTDTIPGGLAALAAVCLLLAPVCLLLNRFLPAAVGKRARADRRHLL